MHSNHHIEFFQGLAERSANIQKLLAESARNKEENARRQAMLADMRRLMGLTQRVTRNFYRCHGRFKETEWQYFWWPSATLSRAPAQLAHEFAHAILGHDEFTEVIREEEQKEYLELSIELCNVC
jgi:hypothetical protein